MWPIDKEKIKAAQAIQILLICDFFSIKVKKPVLISPGNKNGMTPI